MTSGASYETLHRDIWISVTGGGRSTQYFLAVDMLEKRRCATDAVQACRTDGRVSDSDMSQMMPLAMVD